MRIRNQGKLDQISPFTCRETLHVILLDENKRGENGLEAKTDVLLKLRRGIDRV
jgi:hypothetical protein